MNYWEERYQNNETGWDIGSISTPLKEYIDQLTDKESRILLPGAGNGYEFDYLISKGFTNVFVVDIAISPLNNIAKRNPAMISNLLHQDFFTLNEKFDLVLEQTFFCAIPQSMRTDYVSKMNDVLHSKGKIAGLLFDFPLTQEGPPYGGSKDEYLALFSEKFTIKTIERAHNSIKPRQNKELFFIFEKK
jgi:cyclopropane fatty-acyl-phospholipid synthase-like methyltransferase